MASKRTPAGAVALGGVLAAAAVALMAMGTLIPVATYACPMLCILLLQMVLKICGSRMAWAWYGAVTVLSLLLAPDKEAAVVFSVIGYYPILKPLLDRKKGKWLWKTIYFNSVILAAYWLMLKLLGFDRLSAEFSEMGLLMCLVLLILGNVTFFLMDRLLGMRFGKGKR